MTSDPEMESLNPLQLGRNSDVGQTIKVPDLDRLNPLQLGRNSDGRIVYRWVS